MACEYFVSPRDIRRADNPQGELSYQDMPSFGIEVDCFSLWRVFWRRYDVFHLHWAKNSNRKLRPDLSSFDWPHIVQATVELYSRLCAKSLPLRQPGQQTDNIARQPVHADLTQISS